MKILAYISLVISGMLCSLDYASADEPGPWRLQNALGLSPSLTLSGTFRTRYESLDSQFRAGRDGGDQILVLRTTLLAALHQGPFTIAGELIDSRAFLDDTGTPLSSGIVNPAELLQGYLQWDVRDLAINGATSSFRVGRITMDIGSRRFVARNRYRNTINAFTGIDWQWQDSNGRQLRAFLTLPVNRKPNSVAELADNDVEFDEEDRDVKFWGIYYAQNLPFGARAEMFYFGLDEDDSSGRATRNRELSTIGYRLHRKPELARVDYQAESAFQFGHSRASSAAADFRDLDHFAHFHHAELGYTFDRQWRPRLIAQYDFASGDDNPNDGDNGRFDTLFGARRFDFGPTSIYGPFARSNISSPGLRLQLQPLRAVTSFLAYRAFWLASDRDAWTTSRVRDASGSTDSFVGHQIEIRLRYDIVPKNLRLESGLAHLFAGNFIDNAPNSPDQGDATYLYAQMGLTF